MNTLAKNNKGLTLLELIIVVSIIGLLSLVGVPTFKSMVRKSRQTEAKVLLGGLRVAEYAFLAEFGTFGNNLTHIGFEITHTPKYYSIGFPRLGFRCDPEGHSPDPTPESPSGPLIQAEFPDYYNEHTAVYNRVGGKDSSICLAGGIVNPGGTLLGQTYDDYSYMASASGVVDLGVPNDTMDPLKMDFWWSSPERIWNVDLVHNMVKELTQ